MKINCVLIGLTLCVARCSGGGGSGAAGSISVQTPFGKFRPAPIAFSSGTTVLSEDKVHVSVDGVLRTLAVPDWQNNLVPLLQQRAWDYRVFSVRRRFT